MLNIDPSVHRKPKKIANNVEIPIGLSSRIVVARAERGLTLHEVANTIGISYAQLQRIVRKECKTTSKATLNKINRWLEV